MNQQYIKEKYLIKYIINHKKKLLKKNYRILNNIIFGNMINWQVKKKTIV